MPPEYYDDDDSPGLVPICCGLFVVFFLFFVDFVSRL
jgi:hypothetical protein